MEFVLSSLLFIVCLMIPTPSSARAFTSGKTSVAKEIDLSRLAWKLWGYRAFSWIKNFDFTRLQGDRAEIMNLDVRVPGSVQKALLDAGLIKDWNIGTNSVKAEWVENRHWLFATVLPDDILQAGDEFILHCAGLDQKGSIVVNGRAAGAFDNAFLSYDFNLTPFLKEKDNTLVIVFECSPSYLGHSYWTSRIKDWKPRFYYGWDWTPRIVQIGIYDRLVLKVRQKGQPFITTVRVTTAAERKKDSGELNLRVDLDGLCTHEKISVTLADRSGQVVLKETVAAAELRLGKSWKRLNVQRWWPNGAGEQPLYRLTVELLDDAGGVRQQCGQTVGFKHIEWLPCKDAPAHADPWICSVNHQPIFLQGVNWTPIRPNFADLTEAHYRTLLTTYKKLGINIIRIWGGGFPEKDWLYELCDELGILIWQDFPVCSSGLDDYPSRDPVVINGIVQIVKAYLDRRQHHVSILLWCAGNELYELENDTVPVTDRHPMIRAMKEWVTLQDPGRRFLSGSPSGPNKIADWDNFGKQINWDVHGPWTLPVAENDATLQTVRRFWLLDDALFHSEVGVAGAMSAEMIERYRGEYPALPANTDNPLWRNVNWWIEWNDYLREHHGQKPGSLQEYVAWSQKRQAEGLAIALQSCKRRFPGCGGFILWMGHDSFPCPVNTSIIDFDGHLKPAARRLKKIFNS